MLHIKIFSILGQCAIQCIIHTSRRPPIDWFQAYFISIVVPLLLGKRGRGRRISVMTELRRRGGFLCWNSGWLVVLNKPLGGLILLIVVDGFGFLLAAYFANHANLMRALWDESRRFKITKVELEEWWAFSCFFTYNNRYILLLY